MKHERMPDKDIMLSRLENAVTKPGACENINQHRKHQNPVLVASLCMGHNHKHFLSSLYILLKREK